MSAAFWFFTRGRCSYGRCRVVDDEDHVLPKRAAN
jgi:hypothetical protein